MSRKSHLLKGLATAGLLLIASSSWADDYSELDRLISAGQLVEASQKADQYLASHPRDARMRFLKGLVLSEQNRPAEAIAVFVKLTEDFPELPEPYNNLAVLYGKQGQYDQARKSLESAIRTNPSYATAYENLGDVYAKLASQAYSKALQIDGNNTKVTPKLAMIRDLFAPQATTLASAATTAKPAASTPAPAPAPIKAAPPPVVVAAAPPPPPPPPPPPSPSPPPPAPVLVVAAPKPPPAPAPAPAPAPIVAAVPASVPAVKPPVVTAAPVPAPTPALSAPSGNETAQVQAAVNVWASAWSRKDMTTYFAAYTPDFSGGKSRKAWEEERRVRITSKRSISVTLSDFDTRVKGDKATVQFRQSYNADTLKVASRKTLDLVKVDGRWLIQRESTGS